MSQAILNFAGGTFVRAHDGERLARQLDRVRELMADGCWRTLRAIAVRAGGSEASVSARLRDLRKERFGSHLVQRRRRGPAPNGLWEYRVELAVQQ